MEGGPEGAEKVRKEIFTCDVCGAEKKEANHWWMAQISSRQFLLWPWDTGARDKGILHLCGEACVLKRLSEFLGGNQ
jgi:hypothetical protein